MMEEIPAILHLPNELILNVLEYLNGTDVISFSLTCKRFSQVCARLRHLDFSKSWATRLSSENVKTFLSTNIDATTITSCNFSNCYWVPAVILVQFLKKCVNLSTLKVAETRVNCAHLSQVLKKCGKLIELSMSLTHYDLWISQQDRFEHDIKSQGDLLPYTWFKDCHDELKKLLKLELVSSSPIHEMATLVSFCDNLQELIVVFPTWTEKDREKHGTYDRVRLIAEMRNHAVLQGHFSLKTLVFVNMEEEQSLALRDQPRRQEYLVFKSDMSKLTTHWNDSSPCPVTQRNFKALAFKGFSSPAGIYEAWWKVRNALSHEPSVMPKNNWYVDTNPLELVDLKYLLSVREGRPTFMKKGFSAPNAKLINCFYYDDGFSEFCRNHRNLVALRLRQSSNDDGSWDLQDDPANKAGPEWNATSWENLNKLQSLSIESSLLYQERQSAVLPPGKKRKLSHIPSAACQLLKPSEFLQDIFLSCSNIRELEITSSGVETPIDSKCWIDGEDLNAISECANLVSLTLGHFFITDGQFIEEILRKCFKLETLKLKNVGPQLLCCYTKSLCSGLKVSKNLKTLCIFQRNMVPMTMLFDSLESCSGLERLSLVAPSEASPFKMSSESFTRMMINFCTKLSRLVCLFFVINIPKTHCAKAMKELCRKLEVERPSLSIDFQSSEKPQLQTESSVLPLLHRQALIDFSSRVGALPWGMNSDFL